LTVAIGGGGGGGEIRMATAAKVQAMDTSRSSSRNNSTTMAGDQYKAHSKNQYAAHDGCHDLLVECAKRLRARMLQEKASSASSSHTSPDPPSSPPRRRWQMADLGSADGSNAMMTMRKAVDIIKVPLQQEKVHHLAAAPPPCLHLTFEEHPASDEALLRRTLQDHNAWFKKHDITHSVLMKSFYEALFPPSSMDLFLSYICLHWLDTSSTTTTSDDRGTAAAGNNLLRDWKRGIIPRRSCTSTVRGGNAPDEHDEIDLDDDVLTKFVYMNETTAPTALQEKFRLELAHVHLARFFALRARELRPRGEGLVMMVSRPHDWICPATAATTATGGSASTADAGADAGAGVPSPLWTGMQQCVEQGLLRKEVLQRTLVPYYLRTPQDVLEALDLARTLPMASSDNDDGDDKATIYPGSWLELVDMRHYPVHLSGGGEGIFELVWAIHKSSIVAAGPTEAELEAIRLQVKKVFCDSCATSSQNGGGEQQTVFYLACVVRRREDT
jgi:SAM dependent carboxyl methyltransferase